MTNETSKQPEPSKWGKGKTDPQTWWEPGCQSPNPTGRPKGSKNQKTLYKDAFDKLVSVDLDGVPENLPKKAVTYHQIAQQAAAGDLKAAKIQLELDAKFDPVETAPPTAEESAADFATLEGWIALREKFKVFEQKAKDDG
jgi:hypothetical protein